MHSSPHQPATRDGFETHHDVVVVGARCAGAATALLLARAGHDVLLVDKARLPSDTTSTHSLVRGGMVQLARWGLLKEVLSSGAPPIRTVTFRRYDDEAESTVRFDVKAKAGIDHMLAPRRYVLDEILADAAVRAGAVLMDETRVHDVLRSLDGRVVGVRVVGRHGAARQISADLMVGADGVRSQVARLVGAALQERHTPGGACFYTYVGDVDWHGFEFHLAQGAFAGVFPTHFDEACVWLMTPTDAARPILTSGADRGAAWLAALQQFAPDVADRVRAGSTRARLRGAVGLPNHVRQAAGPGWALVGDAGYHRDPITGHGITDAFRDAELLARAADLALSGLSAWSATLSMYERERKALLTPTFRITRALGAFPPPDRFVELQTELGRALDAEAEALAIRPSWLPSDALTAAC